MIKRLLRRWGARLLKHVPSTLDEAIAEIIAQSEPEALETFAKLDGDSPGAILHFGSGMAMRNSWRLWEKEGALNTHFRMHGIWHGDDKSAIIYKALWCKLNKKLFNIDEEARFYKLFWANCALDFDGKELKLTEDERAKIKEDLKNEEARRYSRGPKRRLRGSNVTTEWRNVIDKKHPYGYC